MNTNDTPAADQSTSDTDPLTFGDVFQQELNEIRRRRTFYSAVRDAGDEGDVASAPDPRQVLAGIALSGGGIRSATFCLGVLQGLHRCGLLPMFDYLSTVSGGGYIGGWWSAWLSRTAGDRARQQGVAALAHADVVDPALMIERLVPGRTVAGDPANVLFPLIERANPKLADALRKLVARPDWERESYDDCIGQIIAVLNERIADPCPLTSDPEVLQGLQGSVAGRAIAGRFGVKLQTLEGGALVFSTGVASVVGKPALENAGTGAESGTEASVPEIDALAEADASAAAMKDSKATEGAVQAATTQGTPGEEHATSNAVARANRAFIGALFRGAISGGLFPGPERIEPDRVDEYVLRGRHASRQGAVVEGAMSAGRDPVHHLRLFSNYLTPRKGVMSGDTWRAVAVVRRNLSLTWMALIPILVAVMLVSQLFFMVHPLTRANFPHRHQDSVGAELRAPLDAGLVVVQQIGSWPWSLFAGPVPPDPEREQAIQRVARTNAKVLDSAARAFRVFRHDASQPSVLLDRVGAILWFCFPIVGWLIVLGAAWMLVGNGGHDTGGQRRVSDRLQPLIGMTAVVGLVTIVTMTLVSADGGNVLPAFVERGTEFWWNVRGGHWLGPILWLLAAVVMLVHARRVDLGDVGAASRADADSRALWRKEMRRNRLTRWHALLLGLLVIGSVILIVAGFAHEVVDYVFVGYRDGSIGDYWKTFSGWVAVVSTLVGAAIAAMKASPAGGTDAGAGAPETANGLGARVLFVVVPPAVVLLMALASAWGAHIVLEKIASVVLPALRSDVHPADILTMRLLNWLVFVCAILCFFFTWSEMRSDSERLKHGLFRVSFLAIVVLMVCYAVTGGRLELPFVSMPGLVLGLAILFGGVILAGLWLFPVRNNQPEFHAMPWRRMLAQRIAPAGVIVLVGVGIALAVALAVVLAATINGRLADLVAFATSTTVFNPHDQLVLGSALIGMFIAFVVVVFAIAWGKGSNTKSLLLAATAYGLLLALSVVMLRGIGHSPEILLNVHIALAMVGAVIGWQLAFGWIVDPNPLSLHEFYKARLTRAYLGASNPRRRIQRREITEAVDGDDVLMRDLDNCSHGAPYHLVNTTLNLTGGQDLSIAQRSAAHFLLSKLYCGSARTCYRPTDKYMGGRMSLGTAVAISGAAASPIMGSQTPSAALSMLMTFFNVRLGYWAPTPHKEDWAERQARMWPFYMLREFMSQTNDLSNFSYLTDGGHFDNTGLYALVERGCRYIVFVDCGADPHRTFSDLGQAIRRCRIDFGAEFDLPDLAIGGEDGRAGRSASEHSPAGHIIVGTIRYAAAHREALGWLIDPRPWEAREPDAYIIVIKPTVNHTESADVRQYRAENDCFPQQGTGDQFFDEAQFESYRKLGSISARDLCVEIHRRAAELGHIDASDEALRILHHAVADDKGESGVVRFTRPDGGFEFDLMGARFQRMCHRAQE